MVEGRVPRLHDLYALLDFHDSDRNSTQPRHDLYRRFDLLLANYVRYLKASNEGSTHELRKWPIEGN